MEHDPAVLEYFDQPPSITLRYQAKNGRPIGVLHTPDFFVIRQDAAGWEEWKMEEELLRLAGKMPHRYVHGDNGQWHCPPGEQIAEPLGLYYRVRSSASIHWVVQRNLRFLAYYLRADCPAISNQACEEVLSWVESEPGIILNTLLKRIEGANSDDIYTLLATEQIYADLHTVPLAACRRERAGCHVGHSGSGCVAHGADKSARTDRSRRQNRVGESDPMGWKKATVPALRCE